MAKNNPVKAENKVRYVCHGCTKTAGHFPEPAANMRVVCPHCGKDQVTVLENFIILE